MNQHTSFPWRRTLVWRCLLLAVLLGLSCEPAPAQSDGRPEEKTEASKREVELRKAAEDARASDARKSSSLNRPQSLNKPESLNRPEVKTKIDRATEPLKKADVRLKEGPKEPAPNVGTSKPTDSSSQGRVRAPGKPK